MQHPSLTINLGIIEENTRKLVRLCNHKGVIPVGISRLVEGSEPIARAMMIGGITTIGDTQVKNLMKLKALPIRKMLLRRPLITEVDDVVHHADISLHSDRKVLEALSQAAVKANKRHEVIIMHDLDEPSDEGVDSSHTESLAELVLVLPGLTFVGIGSHLACYGEIESSTELSVDEEVHDESASYHKLEAISGTGIAGIVLMMPRKDEPRLNQLRLGRSLIMGIGLSDTSIPGMPQSAMKLKAGLVEVKEKSSIFVYSVNADSCNDDLQFNDRGVRLRALCAIGKQHVDVSQLTPADDGVMIIGATQNALILDITDANSCYQVGDTLSFYLSYNGVLQCMANESVSKQYYFSS
ncbi:alanine racemase [uncultured Photobacterium sp.]|uniref:alanine racemase n=1 Tax=uncultured Photobacterium sp. TaxID=173973 RepID=UPI00260A6D67|nr:alanine racemase [uncultured Photobacterium sp.]